MAGFRSSEAYSPRTPEVIVPGGVDDSVPSSINVGLDPRPSPQESSGAYAESEVVVVIDSDAQPATAHEGGESGTNGAPRASGAVAQGEDDNASGRISGLSGMLSEADRGGGGSGSSGSSGNGAPSGRAEHGGTGREGWSTSSGAGPNNSRRNPPSAEAAATGSSSIGEAEFDITATTGGGDGGDKGLPLVVDESAVTIETVASPSGSREGRPTSASEQVEQHTISTDDTREAEESAGRAAATDAGAVTVVLRRGSSAMMPPARMTTDSDSFQPPSLLRQSSKYDTEDFAEAKRIQNQ